MHTVQESHLLIFLIQLSVILLLARGIGEWFKRIKQPALTAELLIGVVLGPTVLGRFFPGLFLFLFPADPIQHAMLKTVSWLGVLFLLMDTGLEIDFSSAWRRRTSALTIAFSDIFIPMAISFIPALLLPSAYLTNPAQRIPFALFMAIVMTISAMPVASRVMHDLKILKTDIGYITMSALAVNDIIGWALFTIIISVFAGTTFSIATALLVLVATVGLSILALTFGRRFSDKTIRLFRRKNMPEPASSFTFACLLGLLFGLTTQLVGIHSLFGFFIAGIMVGEAKELREETRSIISQMVHSLFIPVFFVGVGLTVDFAAHFDIALVALITCVGITARFVGAWVGVTLSKVPKVNKTLIAIAHTPGGMMEIVVSVLALETGLITETVFTSIVCSAVFSSIIMGPWMSASLKRRKDVLIAQHLKKAPPLFLPSGCTVHSALEHILTHGRQYLSTRNTYEHILHEMTDREKDFSTAVGCGIAIPHTRIIELKDPLIIPAISREGIDWNAPDGQKVRIIFVLFSPDAAKDLHVEMLAKIVHIMQNEKKRATILEAATPDALARDLEIVFS